jgi:hypothetical protein
MLLSRRFVGPLALVTAALITSTTAAAGRAASPAATNDVGLVQAGSFRLMSPGHYVSRPYLTPPLPSVQGADEKDAPASNKLPIQVAPRFASIGRRTLAAASSPSVGGFYQGLDSAGFNPADAQIAAGPSDLVEMVNVMVQTWSRDGRVRATESLGSYFSSGDTDRRIDQMSDPRVLYDTQSARWFSLAFDVSRHETVMRISQGADPSGGSWLYTFPSSGCPDQPRLGISDTLVAFSDNYFGDCGSFGVLIGGELTVLSKADLMIGASVGNAKYGPDPRFSSITPVQSLGPSSNLFFVASDYWLDSVDVFWAVGVGGTIPRRTLPVRSIVLTPDAFQSAPELINTGDNRIQNAVYEPSTKSIWFAMSDGCFVNGDPTLRACGRFTSIDPFAMTVTHEQEVALAENRDLLYPMVMPTTDGNVYGAFGFTSPVETPGVGVISGWDDPAATWTTIVDGKGANESGRWGDYSGIARDPLDGTRIWVAAAYGTGTTTWSSVVAAAGASPFTLPRPPVASPKPTPPKTKPRKKPKPKPKRKHKK